MNSTEVGRAKLVSRLKELGLNDPQARIYLALLRNNGLRIRDLVDLTAIPRSSIYEHMRGLIKHGLIEEVVQETHKLVYAAPISMLDNEFEELTEEIKRRRKVLETVEGQLENWRSSGLVHPTMVRYYRGIAGARQIFWNTLKAKNTLYVYSEWGRGRYLGIDFYKKFVAESYERGFQEHVITNPKPETLKSIRDHIHSPVSRTEIANIRTIDTRQINFKGDTLMYNDIYVQVFLKDEEITGFEIESRSFVNTQRAIFETLWGATTPVSKLL